MGKHRAETELQKNLQNHNEPHVSLKLLAHHSPTILGDRNHHPQEVKGATRGPPRQNR